MSQHTTHEPYTEGSWSMEDLISSRSGPVMEQAFADLEQAAAGLEAKRSTLVPEIEQAAFAEIIELVERLTSTIQKLDGYTILTFFADMGDQEALALRNRFERAEAAARGRTVFFELWWKALDEANAERLLTVAGDAAYYLHTLRGFAPYTLSEAEEQVIHRKNVHGARSMETLYRTLTGGFTYEVEIDGEPQTMSRSPLWDLMRDPSPEMREAAYRSYLAVHAEHRDELGLIYRSIAGDWHDENVVLRGFSTPISARNLDNDIPDRVVETLLAVCRQNAGLYQRYFRLKAHWLELDRLRGYDLYAPIDDSEMAFSFDDAVRLIDRSFRAFSPVMADHAARVLAAGHLDSMPRPGKRGGGVSWDALPGVTPWVMVTYGGRSHDVTTLAHEMGHAVHALMAAEHSVLTFSPPLPLAETASSFGQILLLETLIQDADPTLRRTLLSKYVEDSYNQILRQAYRVVFEQRAHQAIAEGGSPGDLSTVYLELLREQFGDSVELDELFRDEWLTIGHAFTDPFYDYSYTFGLLLVLALYQRYRDEGEAFVPQYLKILAYGGSRAPIEILDEAGLDIRQRAFWQGGFDVLSGMVDQLASLS